MDDKKGIKVGATAAGLGGVAIGGAKFLEDNYKGKGLTKIKKLPTKEFRKGVVKAAEKLGTTPKEVIKNSKKLGTAIAVTGTTVAGVSAYKHYKNKKRNDTTEK